MNPLAREGFARGAEAYARARPSYPPAALAWVRAQLGLTAVSTVLDLGAGTGKLTALLAGFAKVVAVEPVQEMRQELAKLPRVEVLAGAAEGLPLAAGACDAVLCGQAFHWFATRAALAEIHRVLAPGGGLGLLWNRWDLSVAWAFAVKSLTAPFDAQRPQYETHDWKAAFEGPALFGPLAEARFPNPHRLPRADVVARMASTSSVAVLPPAEQRALLAKVKAVLDTHPDTAGRAELDVPYVTEVWVTRRG